MTSKSNCDRCGKVYNEYLGDRFWSGDFEWEAPDGAVERGDTLCDDCHRDVVRE